MSASNWAICPRCVRKVEQAQADLLARIETDYGKIPAGEYVVLVVQSRQPLEDIKMHTLREDWELGIWKGEFSVHYSASCEECGFSHKFEHKEALFIIGAGNEK